MPARSSSLASKACLVAAAVIAASGPAHAYQYTVSSIEPLQAPIHLFLTVLCLSYYPDSPCAHRSTDRGPLRA